MYDVRDRRDMRSTPTRSRLLCARSCIASARGVLLDATTTTKQSVRNNKADYAAMCLLKAANELRKPE